MKENGLQFFHRLKEALGKPLPGAEAQYLMAPGMRPRYDTVEDIPSSAKQSSVLMLLYPKGRELHTVFIKRTEDNSLHSGQISLPGGKMESPDNSLKETALRETREELGIITKNIQVIGKLTPLYIDLSHFLVQPYLGYITYSPKFSPEPKEVERVIEWPLPKLLSSGHKTGGINVRGTCIEAPYYPLGTDRLWGATAMIVREFIEILQDIA
jgi:8-oxo-dGTP pyrophosphatase MutT (NUDIX family)